MRCYGYRTISARNEESERKKKMKLDAYFVSRSMCACVCGFLGYFVSKLGPCDYDLGATHAS